MENIDKNLIVPDNLEEWIINISEANEYVEQFKDKIFSIFIEDEISPQHLNDFISSLTALIQNWLKFQIFPYPINKKENCDFFTLDAMSYFVYKFWTKINSLLEENNIKSTIIPWVQIESDNTRFDLNVDCELLDTLQNNWIVAIILPFGFSEWEILNNLNYIDFTREISKKTDSNKIITILSDWKYEVEKYSKIATSELQELLSKDILSWKVTKYLNQLQYFIDKDDDWDKRVHLLTLWDNALYVELMTSNWAGVVLRKNNDKLEDLNWFNEWIVIREK
jgi:hypothetical protein